jgi:hypothetical protein
MIRKKWNKIFNGISEKDAESCESVAHSYLCYGISEEDTYKYFLKMESKYDIMT